MARIHKGLMEYQMKQRELRTGETLTPGTRLNLLLSDPEFNWLRVLSLLMVKVDDAIFLKEPITDSLVASLTADVEALLVNRTNADFTREFDSIKNFVPDVIRDLERLIAAIDKSPGLLH